jgi:hypothetical protein
MDKGTKKRRIRNLLLLIFSSIAFAGLFTFFMINHFGPSGRYMAKNALLAPMRMVDLQFNDYNPKTGGSSRFVFDKIEFSHYDPATSKWERLPVTHEQYARFYALIEGDESLGGDDNGEVSRLFHDAHMASLVMTIRTESDAQWQAVTKVFQEIHFVPDGNHYRIELREDVKESIGSRWAYFRHPGIYDQTTNALRGL